MTAIAIRFGNVVRRHREATGLSQEALAELAGLNRAYLGEVERGSAAPTITTMDKLAHALNQNLSDLLLECEHDD
ncbi:MAG TPA: XRE family transcriptional regulator [Candidatus Hydrogenedentes bacterium]|nr:XRE family transcriptional regulator [Candidatus Hydrogenedentota bacterium]